MLKPKVLSEVLSQVNTGGVSTTLVFSKDGRMLAFSSLQDKDVKTIAAIASGIWQSFENYGKLVLETGSLHGIFIECESGCAIISLVANVLLCLHSHEVINPGLLKLKMKACIEFLEKPLYQLSMPN